MATKAVFDPVTRIITLTQTPVLTDGEYGTEIDVKADLYSAGVADWLSSAALRKVKFPIRVVGGNALPSGFLGATFFLEPTWKVKPYEAHHRLKVKGNFYSEDGKSPFIKTNGPYNVFLEQTLSAIVERPGTGMEKGRPLPNLTVVMFNAEDHTTPLAGLSVAGAVSKDGGVFVPLTNAVREMGGGVYAVDITGAERNGDVITLRFTAPGADPRYLTLVTGG